VPYRWLRLQPPQDRTSNTRTRRWLQRYQNVHEGFRHLERVNSGRGLLKQLLENDLRDNWIGEPSCVMVRRSAFDPVGGFNTHVYGTP
jgi:hypothetical protein